MTDVLDVFRALADPTRLRVMNLLRAMELSVGELAQVLGQSQPRVSRHVKILADAGLAERRKEGSWVFLGLGPDAQVVPIMRAIDALQAESGPDHWFIADSARLAAVRADRAAAAERWFADHADEWDAIRTLHIAETEVEAAMERALADAPVGRLVDIGTGTGRMLSLFGGTAAHAIGIDRSPEMLRLARVNLAATGLEKIDLRQGDFGALPLPSDQADTVILHQVLHYAHQPAAVIAEAARLLDHRGRLLIADFAPHHHEALRDSHAHVRLGFGDEQMAAWMTAANLEYACVDVLEGGELTVKLWLGTKSAHSNITRISA
jgi:ArsR family transcriptional regulator